jgi:hypothetical protein
VIKVYTTEERKQRLRQAQKSLIPNLLINLLVPWVLYMLLRPHFTKDTAPLAISSLIPTIRTIVQWGLHRRVDWIGVISIFVLAIALMATYLSGGSALPIKLIQPAIFAIIGLIFLVSVLVGKPLLLIIYRTLKHQNNEHFNEPLVRKKMTVMTALFGGLSFIGSVIHIVMALILSTGSYLALSNMVSVGTIVALMVCAKIIVPRIK